jgi:hypothetical protein
MRGTTPFPGACEECELTDEQNPSVNVLNGTVHHPILVVEDPKPNDLSAQPLHVFICIRLFNGQQDHQPCLHLATGLISHGNGRT